MHPIQNLIEYSLGQEHCTQQKPNKAEWGAYNQSQNKKQEK